MTSKVTNIWDLVPEIWYCSGKKKMVLKHIYWVGHLPDGSGSDHAFVRQVDNIIFILGIINETVERIVAKTPMPEVSFDIASYNLPTSQHLYVLTPMETTQDENIATKEIEFALGVMFALQGRNIAFQRIYTGYYDFETNLEHSLGEPLLNPLAFRPPEISETSTDTIALVIEKIGKLSKLEQAKTKLSLRWFHDSMQTDGVDGFLKFWIALETLAMDTQKINPIKKLVEQIYNLDSQKAGERYRVRLLADLRDDIVHNGSEPNISPTFSAYCEALYCDILLEKLKLKSFLLAEKVLAANPTTFLSN